MYDLDGDVWERESSDLDRTARDMWTFPKFDPSEHDLATGGSWLTPFLLEQCGPLTELPPGSRKEAY